MSKTKGAAFCIAVIQRLGSKMQPWFCLKGAGVMGVLHVCWKKNQIKCGDYSYDVGRHPCSSCFLVSQKKFIFQPLISKAMFVSGRVNMYRFTSVRALEMLCALWGSCNWNMIQTSVLFGVRIASHRFVRSGFGFLALELRKRNTKRSQQKRTERDHD